MGESNVNEASRAIVLHLGVDYGAKHFKLEQCAFNDATFSAPDEKGYQPYRECILDSNETHELGKCFNTNLDVDNLCRELQQYNEAVSVSKNPGRFVCNYVYCLSLDQTNKYNQGLKEIQQSPNIECHAHALFIHVPPFHVVSEGRQLDFILKIMQTIERQVSGSN